MRKITEAARHAFLAGKPWRQGNTTVEVRGWQGSNYPQQVIWVILSLHGNPIARYLSGDTSLRSLRVCDGGWQTRTTKDRLNSLPGVCVHQRNGQWYLNGEVWAGDWALVAPQFTIHSDPLDKKARWRVDFPRQAGQTPESLYFPTEAAAEAFVAIEESNMGLARRSA